MQPFNSSTLMQTPSQTIGPFFSYGLLFGGEHILISDYTKGERVILTGQVLDGGDEPVADAMVEIWQPDAHGYFNHPNDPNQEDADPHFRGFGRSDTVDNGTYRFHTIKPGAIAAIGGQTTGAAPYVNVRVFARGMLIHAVTRIYFGDEIANETDPVLTAVAPARLDTIIAQRVEVSDVAVYRMDIHLQGDNETVFFDA